MSTATIIGAGPAGALTAALLAKRGVETALIDKAQFPRSKVCGCCLSPTAVEALRSAGYGHIIKELGAIPLKKMLLHNGTKSVTLDIENSFALSRSAFDAKLIELAQEEGATFHPGVNATIGALNAYSREILVQSATCFLPTKVVIAADGLGGTSLKNITEMQPVTLASSKIGVGTVSNHGEEYEIGTIYMSTADGGYVGLVRLENDLLDIAAALKPEFLRMHQTPANAVALMLERARLPLPADFGSLEWRGTTSLTRKRAAIASSRIFAIGDSASYVEPFTGEGIAWALLSAMSVAPVADRATRIWDNSLSREWTETYNREIRSRQRKTRVLAGLIQSDLVRNLGTDILARVPALSSLVVEAIHA